MKKYNHIIIFLILTLGIGAAIYGVSFFAGKTRVALDKQERIKLEQEIQHEQIKNLPELAKTYQSILDKERLFSFPYSEDRLVEVIKDIERLAKEESVTLSITQKEIQKQKAGKKEEGSEGSTKKEPQILENSLPYEKHIRLELKAEGRYFGIRDFLHKLETAPYALDVISMNMSLAPLDENSSNRPAIVTGSPFLLGGDVASEEAQSNAPKPEQVIAIIETALYIK